MKYAIIFLLISQAVSLTHIYHLEAGNKNKMPSFLYSEKAIDNIPERNTAPPLMRTEPAELLPDIQSFEDTLKGAPQGELFPAVAEKKVKKKR